MHSVSYYANNQNSNIASSELFLKVNCTGHAVYDYSPFADTVRHDYYLIYMIQGELSVTAPAMERTLSAADAVIFPAEVPFSYQALSESVDYYWVHFTGADVLPLLARLGIPTGKIIELGISRTLTDCFAALFLGFTATERVRELALASALLSLLIAIRERMDRNVKPHNTAAAVVARATAYIHENIRESLSVKQLAAREFLSASRYGEIFREVLGISPQEYILRHRINVACDLLIHTGIPIAAVSLQVGYPDARYFSRVFRQKIGMTPSAYRKRK